MEIFESNLDYTNVSRDDSSNNVHDVGLCHTYLSPTSICTTHSKRPPKHPEYREYAARLDSFVAWPSQYVPQTPENLATAGFFYIGSADRVTCFQCGITLRDWEEDHDPTAEHRKYSPNCAFINEPDLEQLGVAPRLACLDLETDSADIAGASCDSKPCVDSVGIPPHGVVAADAEAPHGDSDDITKSVQDMGFSIIQIQRARDIFRKRNGRDCKNVSEFVDFLLDMENTISHMEMKISKKASAYTTSDNHSSIINTDHSSLQKDPMQKNHPKEVTKSRLSPLVAENRSLRDKKTCKVCRLQDSCILFLPCGHLVTCASCADKVIDCVVCQRTILGTVKTYLT